MRWRGPSIATSAACSSPATCCPATCSASPCTPHLRSASSSSAARCSPTFCWPMRSTAPRQKRSQRLLEAMNERQVTVDGHPHPLPNPFLVIATQNPVEHHGTYPLPESQLDRFLIRARMGYPEAGSEREILRGRAGAARIEELRPVLYGRRRSGPSERRGYCARRGFPDRLFARHCGAHAPARTAFAGSFAARIADAVSCGAGHGVAGRPHLLHSR